MTASRDIENYEMLVHKVYNAFLYRYHLCTVNTCLTLFGHVGGNATTQMFGHVHTTLAKCININASLHLLQKLTQDGATSQCQWEDQGPCTQQRYRAVTGAQGVYRTVQQSHRHSACHHKELDSSHQLISLMSTRCAHMESQTHNIAPQQPTGSAFVYSSYGKADFI